MNQDQALALVAESGWDLQQTADKIYAKDPSLWSSDPAVQRDIAAFLGWVDAPLRTRRLVPDIVGFAEEAKTAGFTDAVVLGMGGSSLSSLMFAHAFPDSGGLKLHVLDSTVPGDVLRVKRSVNLKRTLILVASKSGTTIEPLAFEEYFFAALQEEVGRNAPSHMVAITDPGSQMEARAKERGYRHVFLGEPEVGGRFSVFTVFGMVPAALAGLPVASILDDVCGLLESHDTHGFESGLFFGVLAKAGVDKVTFATPKHLEGVALWAEQLIAESTGKNGVGVLPLATEPLGQPESYGPDRLFFAVTDGSHASQPIPGPVQSPQVTAHIDSPQKLGKVLMWLELATAAAGAVLGVNPFDQPNVQAAKDIAKSELVKIQQSGRLPDVRFDIEDDILAISGSNGQTVGQALSAFINQGQIGDVATFLAFLPESPQTTAHIQTMRAAIRDRLNLATAFGYGPRYLHSTGQYHKGGPNNGLYIVLTAQDAEDPAIPGMGATFGQLKMAQAIGDIGALRANGRRVVHVHLKTDDVERALAQLSDALHIASAP
ncbi:MAG: hypothetical protein JSS71_04170 [Armatimonadetes bacterium]|nr:hypothetical protein [Armatimonadota bacterium]MBX3108580.1 hypothetical protein [Fimbriimonadaceae bacterium]